MSSYNLEFLKDDLLLDISENIYSDSNKQEIKEWLNKSIKEIKECLNDNIQIKLCCLDMLGNKKHGYELNMVYYRKDILKADDFYNHFNENTKKLFKRKLLKELNIIYK